MCPVFLGGQICLQSFLILNFLLCLCLINACPILLKNNFTSLKQRPAAGPAPGSWVRWLYLYNMFAQAQSCDFGFALFDLLPFFLSFPFSCCSGGGVLDNHSGPVPEHQRHVHPLSEPSHSSWSGSRYQVRWCVMRTVTCSWSLLQLISLCVWLRSYRLANGSASLIAVGNTSRSEFVKHLKRYSSSSGQVRSAASVKSRGQNGQNAHW